VNVAEGDDLIIFIDGDGRLDMEAHPLIGGTGRFAWSTASAKPPRAMSVGASQVMWSASVRR
jgi:hypothetical protein